MNAQFTSSQKLTMVVFCDTIRRKGYLMTNEIVSYENTPIPQKKSSWGGILGFLLCLRTGTTKPACQEIQSIHHVLPSEEILRQIIDLFIANTQRPEPASCGGTISWDEHMRQIGDSYSEAMSGAPVCALIKTPTDAWLVALTRTVKLRWPKLILGSEQKSYERLNLDDFDAFLKKQLKTREYQILRHTESWKAVISPFNGKKLDLMSGYLFKWKGDMILAQTPLSAKSKVHRARLFALNVPNLLKNMQNFHTHIEEDEEKKKKYISSEIYTRPEDYDHPRSVGHTTEYFVSGDFLSFRGRYFIDPGLVVHGVEESFNGLYPVREISFKDGKRRIVIPPPQNGERLIYKAEEKFYLPMRKTPELE